MNDSLYDILGINKDATQEEIKTAYREKAKIHHPDKEGGDTETMNKINKAYEVLKDPVSRKRYDETGSTEKVPDFNKRFEAFIQDVFISLVNSQNVKTTDLISAFDDHIDKMVMDWSATKAEYKRRADRLNLVVARLRSTTDYDPFKKVVQANIDALEQTLKTIDLDIEFVKECKERLKNHSYECENKEPIERLFLTSFTFNNP